MYTRVKAHHYRTGEWTTLYGCKLPDGTMSWDDGEAHVFRTDQLEERVCETATAVWGGC